MGSGAALYLIASIAGYVCFNGMPPADILTGFSSEDASINGVRIALGLCMIRSARSLRPFFLGPATHAEARHRLPFRVLATSIFLLAAFVLAVTAEDVGVVMGWIGGTTGILLAFTVPGYFVWQVSNDTYNEWTPTDKTRGRAVAVGMMATGVVLTIISVTK
ncbi:hypothetical protein SPRG_09212 [Saprolegnia parasitica CBS 223.65]|uniref:Uncharacterized protein n=1 Tax=Saprolegnia parasitica (strain CBS 223.65) TaxID=695850 RepID=A0A067C3H2_SAPPC|nr:hypothetical protein SPRG_09212 [Saprolegnia parasitica CBS 223.65]KDO25073.1 hypothetical protein SPRG_09212 [Saprolegnia parasitica CBS 223.65]|eukprot:XP_012204147.1 hypothetical protein SPRG_09212 [Saprolegnia parasitica CBS 223.65]